MKRFIKDLVKFSLIGIIPLAFLTIGYFYYDPFKVLRSYDNYSYPYVIPNRDYISTEMFMKNNKANHYNSFVFGSSRTIGFKPLTWQTHLSENDKPFMFDASGESINGIYTKLKYLDSIHAKIDNALLIICRDATFRKSVDDKGLHLFIKHPTVSGKSNLDFQLTFYKAYLSPKFLRSFYDYTFSKKFKPYMKGFIEDRKVTFDTVTNEFNIVDQEIEISQSPKKYYEKRKDIFYIRKPKTDTVRRIEKNDVYMLKEIHRILEKNKTNYKVVLSPLYEQIKFNPKDLALLNSVFGENVYDFSGKNHFTDPISNYYESSHFRPVVGDSIMKIIYK